MNRRGADETLEVAAVRFTMTILAWLAALAFGRKSKMWRAALF
jgi:hypothetical protein